MNSEEAYQLWAPIEGPWSPWVKPILFASEPDWSGGRDPELVEIPEPSWLAAPRSPPTGYRDVGSARTSTDVSTAYVVDVPGVHGVAWGVALARKGFRPVPLYNALPGGSPRHPVVVSLPVTAQPPFASVPLDTSALVDMGAIVGAMRRATAVLGELALAPDRAPVFLLDADRRFGSGVPLPGRFDNRSISLPTDFPSAVFLRSRGVERVVLLQSTGLEPQEDLAHTLLAWQEGGITILAKSLSSDAAPATIEVTRPSRFRALAYRFFATLGLTRNPLGGFGGTIPVPSAG